MWGRRRSDWDRPTAPTPVCRDLLRGLGEVLDRTELATGHGQDLDRPEEGRGQEGMGGAEARGGRAERARGSAREDAIGRQPLPSRLHRSFALVDMVGGDHHDDGGGHDPEHHERQYRHGDLPPPGGAPTSSSVVPLGPAGELVARSPGLAVIHRGERTASVPESEGSACSPPGLPVATSQLVDFVFSLQESDVGGELWGSCATVGRHCDLWLCPVERIPWNDGPGGLATSD